MPRDFIADSDDDDGASVYSPPHSPRGASGGDGAAARSSGLVSHATTSTDPVFFRNVFDEQNDVAQEHALGIAGGGGAGQHKLSSPGVSAPPGGLRLDADYDATLLTSVTEPTPAKARAVSSGRALNELTQVTTPGRGGRATGKDPWDVPSSPETTSVGRTARKSSTHTEKPSIQDDSLEDAVGGHDTAQGDSSERSRKRRKIDASQQSEELNDVDLVAFPTRKKTKAVRKGPEAHAPSSCLVPTLPPDTDSSLFIVPRAMTASQKMQYQSVNLESSMDPPPSVKLLQGQHEGLILGSSGSATNVNTPRSEDKSSRDVSRLPGSRNMIYMAEAERASSPKKGYSSSPDVISAMEPTSTSKQAKKRKAKRGSHARVSPVEKDEEESDWEDTAYRVKARPEGPQANDENDEEAAPKVVPPKKQRGRPKKKMDSDNAPATANPPVSRATDGEPANKGKKKRGRPKKSATEAEKAPPTSTGALGTDITNGAQELESKVDTEGGQADKTRFTPGEVGEDEPSEAVLDDEEQQQSGQDDTTPKTTTAAAGGCGSGVRAATDTGSLGPARAGSRGSSGPGSSRPLYRVGLSKRSRIAPLLKMVRK